MVNFLLGIYTSGIIFTFIFVGFFCVLGGKSSDLWKPFFYAIMWPLMFPIILGGKI